MKNGFSLVILSVLGMILICIGVEQLYDLGVAQADGVVIDAGVASGSDLGSGSAVAAGSGSDVATGSGAVTPTPVQVVIPDPTENPSGFVDTVNTAKKKGGWLGMILIGVYALTRLLGKAKKYWSKLELFDHGYPAMIVAIVATVVSAMIDALFLGGGYVPILTAGLWALVGSFGTKRPA